MSDPIRHTLGVYFDLSFLRKKGTEFQDFFSDIMELRFPGDFSRVRPWGKRGDEKCDGYIASRRQLFAVYAPKSFTESKLISKIDSDFSGAKEKWDQYVDAWTFVHNDPDGMSPGVVKKITNLKTGNPELEITHWGMSELKTEAMLLSTQQLEDLLGPVPTAKQLSNLGFEELRLVVESIERNTPEANADILSVPPGKLDANALSDDIRGYLKLGMGRSNRVAEFFRRYHDPELGDAVAERFKREYAALKNDGHHPDEIFQRLLVFAGGPNRLPLPREAAIMAVLAYLFESCDIFEAPGTAQ